MIQFDIAVDAADFAAAKRLFREYADSIGIDLEFQQFDQELNGLEQMYVAPRGGIILARDGREEIGCAGVRRINDTTGELKRMYIKPGYQHMGIGKQLLEQSLQLARECNYKAIKLDTLTGMKAAIRLYKQAGFLETAPYYNNPVPTAIYFEKML